MQARARRAPERTRQAIRTVRRTSTGFVGAARAVAAEQGASGVARHRRGALRGPLAAVVVVVVVVAPRAPAAAAEAAAPPAFAFSDVASVASAFLSISSMRFVCSSIRDANASRCADSTDGAAAIAGAPGAGIPPAGGGGAADAAAATLPPPPARLPPPPPAAVDTFASADAATSTDGARARSASRCFAAATSSRCFASTSTSPGATASSNVARNPPASAPRGPAASRHASGGARTTARQSAHAAARGPRTDANANARGPAATSRPPSNATTRFASAVASASASVGGAIFDGGFFSQKGAVAAHPTHAGAARGSLPGGRNRTSTTSATSWSWGTPSRTTGARTPIAGSGPGPGAPSNASTTTASPTKRRPLCAWTRTETHLADATAAAHAAGFCASARTFGGAEPGSAPSAAAVAGDAATSVANGAGSATRTPRRATLRVGASVGRASGVANAADPSAPPSPTPALVSLPVRASTRWSPGTISREQKKASSGSNAAHRGAATTSHASYE